MITEYGKNTIEIDHETLIPRWSITQIYPDKNAKKEIEFWICYDQDQINITPQECKKLKAWMNESALEFPMIWKE